ncbi:MAG: RNA-binding cell elongation regulator Jag/EloR [Eubacteriales bacterium]|nr:RNA-binding cell elongation regulator Jag/EloR [Eubacteriales bacterium]
MEDYIQFSAKTKSEAITKACIELGTSSDQLEIQVISEGSSGFFGIGSKPAIIKARKIVTVSEDDEIEKIVDSVKLDFIKEEKRKETRREAPRRMPRPAPAVPKAESPKAEKPEKEIKDVKEVKEAREPREFKERQPKPSKERHPKEKSFKEKQVRENREKPVKEYKEKGLKEKPVKDKPVKVSKPVEILTDPEEIREIEERAVVFLRDVFASMNLGEVEITSKYNSTDGSLEVDFEGEDMGILIGKRGQTLDSLQYLTSLVVNKGKANYIRVKLDTEDYRRRRKETLENLARGIAYKVKKTRKPVVLEPMNPYERRIIHSALQGNKFVETVSEGEEPYRHVVVKLKRY